ncbi:acetyl-CoA carboxylase carboxyl transferase subunit beta, partial [Lactobacillus delbrueckii subsp. bulgaricus]|nr:acetyl-CoA carboxylase carboxyl transferase subunit beta [Lactobacillus delbrueckii subsp. bulgaricus]
HEQLPKDAQRAETVLKHGFIDRIVLRQEEKETLAWLLKYGGMQDD